MKFQKPTSKKKNALTLPKVAEESSITNSGDNSPLIDKNYEKKKLRRQIVSDFGRLQKKGVECNTTDVAEFVTQYYPKIDILKEALQPFKYSDGLASTLTWKYLNEDSGQELNQLIVEQQLRNERKSWIEKKIPDPIILNIECTDQGPDLIAGIEQTIQNIIMNSLTEQQITFKIFGIPSIRNLGEYSITLEFAQREIIKRTINLLPIVENFSIDNYPDLASAAIIPFDTNIHILEAMQPLLSQSQQSDFSEYFTVLTSVLKTVYFAGYWKTSWAQDFFSEWKSELESYRNGTTGNSSAEIVLNKILEPPQVYGNKPSIISEGYRRVRTALILVKSNIFQAKAIEEAPKNHSTIIQTLKSIQAKKPIEVANTLLAWAKTNTVWGKEATLRTCVALYCFYSAKHQYSIKPTDSRSYLFGFFFVYNQLPANIQKELNYYFYESLYIYFNCYNINVKPENSTSTQESFYTGIYPSLAKAKGPELGNALTTLAIISPAWTYDLINRIKTRPNQNHILSNITNALLDVKVFRVEPLQCLTLLSKIDSKYVSIVIGRQNLSNLRPDERRLIAVSLLRFLNSNSNFRESGLRDFATASMTDAANTLAFSCLVEPYFLSDPKKEGELKAFIISKALGLPEDSLTMTYFIAQASDLANLFDKFSRSTDSNIKGGYGYNILNKIHSFRRYMADNIRGNLKETVFRFFRRVEAHLTIEQSKLIFDPILEIVLLHDRTFYSNTNTRLVFEIRNIGEGIADSIELELLPSEGKYEVEENFKSQTIENLSNKTIIQKELFFKPLVSANQSIEVDILLRYHTLKGETKIAELPSENRTVWLYEESEFLRVESPYSISAPATTWFFGRQDLLRGMIDNLKGGSQVVGHSTSMIIYGLKRAGKTSVVKRFIENTLGLYQMDNIYIPIYIDLLKAAEKTETTTDFLGLILESIYDATIDQLKISMPFNREYIREGMTENPYNTFSDLAAKILKEIPNNKILMVLDEFSILQSKLGREKIDGKIDPYVFSFLSNTIQSTNQLTFFFTGTYGLMEMMRDQAFDLAKICTPRLISYLDDDSAHKLVTEPVALKNENSRGYLEFHPRAVNRIVTVTNRHPYLIQYICMLLIERMNETVKHSRVNLSDVNRVINDVVSKPAYEMPMLTLWNEFGSAQHKVLSAIAALAIPNSELHEQASFQQISVVQDGISIQEIEEYLEGNRISMEFEQIIYVCKSLTDAELLERIAVSGDIETYRITIPLYEAWLKRNRSVLTSPKE